MTENTRAIENTKNIPPRSSDITLKICSKVSGWRLLGLLYSDFRDSRGAIGSIIRNISLRSVEGNLWFHYGIG